MKYYFDIKRYVESEQVNLFHKCDDTVFSNYELVGIEFKQEITDPSNSNFNGFTLSDH